MAVGGTEYICSYSRVAPTVPGAATTMDYINVSPPAIQDRLPEGPSLTDWLLAEVDRAHAAAARLHALGCEATCRGPEVTLAWLKMMRALVFKHCAGPTYVTNVFDPTGPDMRDGWHCQECGLDRDGPTDDWPCEVLIMVATTATRMRKPSMIESGVPTK